MYVCICHSVTDRQIRRAVDDGARRLRDLRQSLGVAGSCGRCAQCAKELLNERLASNPQPSLLEVALGYSDVTATAAT